MTGGHEKDVSKRERRKGDGKERRFDVDDGQQHVRYKLTPASLAFLFIGKFKTSIYIHPSGTITTNQQHSAALRARYLCFLP